MLQAFASAHVDSSLSPEQLRKEEAIALKAMRLQCKRDAHARSDGCRAAHETLNFIRRNLLVLKRGNLSTAAPTRMRRNWLRRHEQDRSRDPGCVEDQLARG